LWDQFLPLPLRHAAVEPHEIELVFLQNGLDQIEHRRPFGKDDDFAPLFLEQPFDQIVDVLQLG
jgi:hypothetical protein